MSGVLETELDDINAIAIHAQVQRRRHRFIDGQLKITPGKCSSQCEECSDRCNTSVSNERLELFTTVIPPHARAEPEWLGCESCAGDALKIPVIAHFKHS